MEKKTNEERVRAIAYQLWLEEGRPEGRAEQHWLKAAELAAREFVIPDVQVVPPKRKAAARKSTASQKS